MRVFLAGATGAVGRPLVPALIAAGHEVTGMTRSPGKAAAVRAAGAEAVLTDALDADAVGQAVRAARPDVVIHMLTALGSLGTNMRRIDRDFELTNRLRTEGTDHLLRAARAAGASRLIAQSYTGWPYAREGGPVKTEEDPLDPDPPKRLRSLLAALRHLEGGVTGTQDLDGVVLRFGAFYGPGTSISHGPEGVHLDAVLKRRFPLVGDAGGVWSFTQIDDAVAATVAAVGAGAPGLYNVVDDDPAPVREWLPVLAEAVGAPAPRHVPELMGRLVAGEEAVTVMCRIRGASNEKARRELPWQPRWSSWRDGFRQALGD